MTAATFTVWNEDCISGMAQRLAPESAHLCVTSIPFEELFVYTGKLEDVGNNGCTLDLREGRFALNLRFFAAQLLRVLQPGCNFCCHVQQLLAYKNQHGFQGRRNFRDAMIDLFQAAGFRFTGEFVIAKDPQAMAQKLNLHSLQFKTGHSRDARNLMPAVNDYVLILQKPGDCPVPVRCLRHPKNPGGWVGCDEWVRDACGIWSDILEVDVLGNDRALDRYKEQKTEKHVCPLQLEVIRRLVRLYTNPGETVLDPFAGIGSTGYVCLGGKSPVTRLAVEAPREFVGFELKESYYRGGLAHCAAALAQQQEAEPATFDFGEPA